MMAQTVDSRQRVCAINALVLESAMTFLAVVSIALERFCPATLWDDVYIPWVVPYVACLCQTGWRSPWC